MNSFIKKAALGVSAFLAGALISSPALADDTEVYFGGTTPSNILLILDESGSMAWDTVVSETHNYFSYFDGDQWQDAPHDYDYLQQYYCRRTDWRGRCQQYGWRVIDEGDVTRGTYYRWAHGGSNVSRMSVLKEAAKIFINDLEDNTRVGIMTYTTGNINLRQAVRPMSDYYSSQTHKEHLLDTIDDMSPDSGTPTAGALLKAAEYYRGEYSPIIEKCGLSNNMILLTDGEPNTFYNSYEEDIEEMVGGDCVGTYDSDGNASIGNDVANNGQGDSDDGERCSMDLAEFLANNPQKEGIDDSQVITSTIAFSLADERAQQYLKDVAAKAKGNYAEATDVDSLVEAFRSSISSSVKAGSLVAPSVPLSQNNRLRSGNEMFMAMFRPLSSNYWPGNLKKYYLKNGLIHSEDLSAADNIGAQAVNEDSGKFLPSAQSAWTSSADGSNVVEGGAAQDLGAESVPVYSDLFSKNLAGTTENTVDAGTTAQLTETQFEELFGPDTTESDSIDYTTWIALKKITLDIDVDGDDKREEVTLERFGDPLHSEPVIVDYGDPGRTVYIATNQGYLHAIDPDDGSLRWSFMPRAMMTNVPDWKANLPLASPNLRDYGIDGKMTVYEVDNDNDGVIEPADGDSRTLYIGMRRGGYEYYSLDITNMSSPKLRFTVKSGYSKPSSYPFYNGESVTVLPNLGQTWSRPIIRKIKWNGNEKTVMFFGGGYDGKHDNPSYDVNTSGQKGNTIYALDAFTGEPLPGFSTKVASAGITNAVAADLNVFDVDNDGFVDHIYAADVGGKVYRVDLPTEDDNSDFDAGLIANVNNNGSNRRFYNKPDVSFTNYAGNIFAMVAIGSGYRAKPKNEDTTDRMYVFYDKYISEREFPEDGIVESELKDVTTTENGGFATIQQIYPEYEGWYITMPKGEKVLSDSTTINYNTLFTTYKPGTPEEFCEAATGSNKAFGVSILDGRPSIESFYINDGELNEQDRFMSFSYDGIAPGITYLQTETGSVLMSGPTQLIGDEVDRDLGLPETFTTIKWKQEK